jgi:hypothetical protein
MHCFERFSQSQGLVFNYLVSFIFFLDEKNETKKIKNEIQPCFFLAAQDQPPLSQKKHGSHIWFTPAAPLIIDFVAKNN